MLSRAFLVVATWLVCGGAATVAWAQMGIRQIADDYRQPTHYSPDDPWTRSAVYRNHVGHFGLFYNCDGEEAKRCSPYICWKSQDNRQCQRGPWSAFLFDLALVQQRIRWGGCQDDRCPPVRH